jgi:protein SCO1/2
MLPRPAPHPHEDAAGAQHAGHEAYGPWTKEEVAEWARGFNPRFLSLTGTRQQILEAVRAFQVRREHLPARWGKEKANGYRVDHTTHVYLLDPAGKVATVFYYGESADDMAAKLKEQMARGGANPAG